MTSRALVLAVIAAAVTLTSVAAASPEVAKQRVAITATGLSSPTSTGGFVLTQLTAGALEADSGTETSTWTTRTVMRNGQTVEIANWVTTCKGKRGTLVLRLRIEHVDAGNDYVVGTGTWKVVRGTGEYAGVTGSGGVGTMFRHGGRWNERREGFLIVP